MSLTDINIDLSRKTLLAACKGNVAMLPRFVVVDNDAWPWPESVRLDSQGRIHIRRTTFLRVTQAEQLPVKPGLWIRADSQEFFIDLKPEHIDGGADAQRMVSGDVKTKATRPVVRQDESGRSPGDEGYGEVIPTSGGDTDPTGHVVATKRSKND